MGDHVGRARTIRKLLPLIHRTAATQNHRPWKKSDRESSQIIKRPGPTRSVRNSVAASLRLRSNNNIILRKGGHRVYLRSTFRSVEYTPLTKYSFRNMYKHRQNEWAPAPRFQKEIIRTILFWSIGEVKLRFPKYIFSIYITVQCRWHRYTRKNTCIDKFSNLSA